MKKTLYRKALDRAVMGCIGDGATRLKSKEVQRRFEDQCDRIGVYALSWSSFVREVRACGYLQFDDIDTIDVIA